MQTASTTAHEAERITSLRDLNLLDTPHEERFDRLTRVARRLFNAPIALISLVDTDRQWFKSCVGTDVAETSRDVSFCAHAILEDQVFVVPDALLDERFSDNPLVAGEPHIRFYAGCPLTLADGYRLGTLCIIDRVPRCFDDDDRQLLNDLARLAEHELTGFQHAITDPLTGISNLDGFTTLGAHTLQVCNRLGKAVSLLSLDVAAADPTANDLFGVPDDDAIVQFADILVATFPDCDVLGRIGAEQFGVLISEARGSDFGDTVCRLRHAVEHHNEGRHLTPRLAFDAGSAIGDPCYEIDFDELFSAARQTMRPQIEVYDPAQAP